MRPEHIRAVLEVFWSHGFEVLLVGGVVMERRDLAATSDVDLLITVAGFERLPRELATDPRVSGFQSDRDTALGFVTVGSSRLRFDVLNPAYFSGTKTGDEFFELVRDKWSTKDEVGLSVLPQVVWYTRLFVNSEAYLERIIDELNEGAPVEWLDEALRLARILGTEARVRTRLIRLNEIRQGMKQ